MAALIRNIERASIVDKSPSAFRTISEVSTELDVPKHVLRFWESKFNQIKPMKLGGGRRYYRPEDMELLRGIRGLLYDQGYTIRGVQRILKENGVRFVKDLPKTGGQILKNVSALPDIPDVAADAKAGRSKKASQPSQALASPRSANKEETVLPAPARKVLLKVLAELEWCRDRIAAAAAA